MRFGRRLHRFRLAQAAFNSVEKLLLVHSGAGPEAALKSFVFLRGKQPNEYLHMRQLTPWAKRSLWMTGLRPDPSIAKLYAGYALDRESGYARNRLA